MKPPSRTPDETVISLAAYRERATGAAEPVATTSAAAKDAAAVEFDLVYTDYDGKLSELSTVMPVATAEHIAHLLRKAANAARILAMPKCPVCGEHACNVWHVGSRYKREYWGEAKVVAVCERFCKRSVRLRDIATGKIVYVGMTPGCSWRLLTGPWLESVQALPP